MKAKTKNKANHSLIVKLIIMGLLGALGIAYIMKKPPTGEVRGYQKQSMAKPFLSRSKDSSSSSSSNNNGSGYSSNSGDSDAISLTGSKGSYDSHRVGKQ